MNKLHYIFITHDRGEKTKIQQNKATIKIDLSKVIMKGIQFPKVFRKLFLLLVVLGISSTVAVADVNIVSPDTNTTIQVEQCPIPSSCTASLNYVIQVKGAPMDSVFLDFVESGHSSNNINDVLCSPADPIEPHTEDCPLPPFIFKGKIDLNAGNYTATARVVRGNTEEISSSINIVVLDKTGPVPGAVALNRVEPNHAAPALIARANSFITKPDTVKIFGDNLQNNPSLRVYLAQAPLVEYDLSAESALPIADWCKYEVEVINQKSATDNFLEVRLPNLASEMPDSCGINSTSRSSIFLKDWRWLIHDRWIRPERVHSYWAIPSPRDVPWKDMPPFKLIKPAYPLIDGFGFKNQDTKASYNEFLTVYGDNAYLCVGALGLCASHLPDPLYHIMWWGIYKLLIDSTGGSCNGIAATSLLMSREKLQPEDFEADAHYPMDFATPGRPAKYSSPSFCTPICSPPKPNNLWAEIRKNHGIQFSREFLGEMLKTLGQATLDIGDISTLGDEEFFQGVPSTTLKKVRANPHGYVLCFTKASVGHCVTPYAVKGNRISIYDSNAPREMRFIDITNGEYSYPAASTDELKSGKFIIAYPISIWENERNLWGLSDFLKIANGETILDFLSMIVAGSADMVLTNDSGERFGWENDDSFSRTMPGVMTLPVLGPGNEPNHNGLFFLSTNHPETQIEINADGGLYAFHTGAGKQLFQLEAAHAQAGDKDHISLVLGTDRVDGLNFSPQRDANTFVARAGMDFDNEESSVFSWLGLVPLGGKSVAFGANRNNKSVSYTNKSNLPSHHLLSLDHSSGVINRYGRTLYGPFEVPAGATHTMRLANWPETELVVSELDLDGDGTPDSSKQVRGHPVDAPANSNLSADLVVTRTVDHETVAVGEAVIHTIKISNTGTQTATSITLIDNFSSQVSSGNLQLDNTNCSAETTGLRCELGDLSAGEVAMITYTIIPSLPGVLMNGAFVYSALDDPNWSNNTAVATVKTSIETDSGNEDSTGGGTIGLLLILLGLFGSFLVWIRNHIRHHQEWNRR